MVGSWSQESLGDLVEIKYGKDHKKLSEGDIPCYGTGGIMRYVDSALSEQESILIPRKGSLNNIYYINEPFWTVDTLFWSKIDTSKVDGKFLFYSLSLIDFVNLNVGSAVPSLTVPVLNDIKFKIPPIPEQKAIAHILGTLDDKIELNRKTNETLEAMAQALFKSWFVDFDPVIDNAIAAGNDIPEPLKAKAATRQEFLTKNKSHKTLPDDIRKLFPNEFEFTEEMGWVPKGWGVSRVDALTENIFSGGTPHTQTPEYWNGELSWFSSGETRESIVIQAEKSITEKGVSESSTKLAKYGDTLIASAGQGHTRGQTSFCTIDTYFNQSVVCVRPLKSIYDTWLFFNLYSRYDEMRAISDSHSIRGSLTTKLVASLKLIVSDDEIIEVFKRNADSNINKIKQLKVVNKNLTKLRDTLLPKLLSGELRIPDAEKLIENIA